MSAVLPESSRVSDEILHIPDVVPIFPLPGVVLLPNTLVPLRMFEPRYVEMTRDALAGSNFLAIALLREGFQPLYYTKRAPVYPVIGIGRIVAHEHSEDDETYHVLLRGVARARIVREVGSAAYREAEVELVETTDELSGPRGDELRAELEQTVRRSPVVEGEMRKHWLQLMDSEVDLEVLVDVIGAALPADAELRQCLLAEPQSGARLGIVLQHLRALEAKVRTMRRASKPGGASLN